MIDESIVDGVACGGGATLLAMAEGGLRAGYHVEAQRVRSGILVYRYLLRKARLLKHLNWSLVEVEGKRGNINLEVQVLTLTTE